MDMKVFLNLWDFHEYRNIQTVDFMNNPVVNMRPMRLTETANATNVFAVKLHLLQNCCTNTHWVITKQIH